jgi:hypothetical protein
MSAQPITRIETLANETCCSCGIAFAVPVDFQRRRLADHEWFYCPSGHKQHYEGKSEVDRLKDQLEAERQRTARAEESRRWAETAAKGARIAEGRAKAAKKRLEHRVNCGVCPHCQRTFSALARHIKTQHPQVVKK